MHGAAVPTSQNDAKHRRALPERRGRWLFTKAPIVVVSVFAAVAVLALVGCVGPVTLEASPRSEAAPAGPSTEAVSGTSTPTSYLLLNQRFIEGLYTRDLNLLDADAVFWHVFSRLPDEVVVYPSENYFYFILNIQGRQIWGNIRIPAGKRDEGEVSFGYFEFNEFPQLRAPRTGLTNSKFFTAKDGLELTSLGKLDWVVRYRGKQVVFHLYSLPQVPPKLFPLGDDEVFVERTFDESGYQFFLLFNDKAEHFFWVLNEEPGVPDILVPDADHPDLLMGQRSGFAFWRDGKHGNRKVLIAIRRLNSNRNDYYDGPFDQLADNYAEEVRISEYMQRAAPALRGRIDKFGYYTDQERPMRVALACYYSYLSRSDLLAFLERARAADDFYDYVSRRGIPRYGAKVSAPETRPAVDDVSPVPAGSDEEEGH